MRVREIHPGIRKLSLIVLDGSFILQNHLLLIVQLLLGDRVSTECLLVAFQIDLGLVQSA